MDSVCPTIIMMSPPLSQVRTATVLLLEIGLYRGSIDEAIGEVKNQNFIDL